MKVIAPSVSLEEKIEVDKIMRHIEKAGRVCYKSESNISNGSADKFIRNILKCGHESVVEHISVTFKVVCNRGVTHEIE
jgi:thymidylate synthase (FAD)